MTTYDVHAHCIPAELFDLFRSDGPRLGIELRNDGKGEYAVIRDRVRLQPFNPVLSDLEARIQAMDATGVDVQLLSGWIDLTAYALDADAGAEYSRRFNEIIAAEAGRFPDRLIPLGTIPLQDPRRAAQEWYGIAVARAPAVCRSPPPSMAPTSIRPDSTPFGKRPQA